MTFFDTLKKALEEETKNLKVGLSSVKKDLEENLREGANSLGSFLREPKEGKDFMRFDLSEEEAKIIKKNLSRTDLSPVGTNPTTIKRGIAETVQATPRGLAGLALQGAEFMTKPITGKKEEPVNIPKLFQPLFGSDPIKRTGETEEKKDFEVGLKHYGEPGEVADPIATGTMLFMAGLDLFGGGSGKIPKEITEQLIKKYGDDVAKEIIKKGGKNLATVAIKEGGEEVVKKSGIVVSGKITPQLEPLAQDISKAKASCQYGDLTWARGTRVAGIQNAGLKNYNQATKVLENAGELPRAVKTETVTKDYLKNYYETKKPPVVGDTFTNAKGEVIEVTKVESSSINYFLKGKNKGIEGTVYTDKGFLTSSKLADTSTKVADDITTSIKSAKQSGQSFDEWVKGQGENLQHATTKEIAEIKPINATKGE